MRLVERIEAFVMLSRCVAPSPSTRRLSPSLELPRGPAHRPPADPLGASLPSILPPPLNSQWQRR